MLFMHLFKQFSKWKDVLIPTRLLTQMHEKHTIKPACLNGLSYDEHMMFKTCKRQEELNLKINFKNVHFVCL
jgi:hypothetical protein